MSDQTLIVPMVNPVQAHKALNEQVWPYIKAMTAAEHRLEVVVRPAKRSTEHNARLHATIGWVAQHVEWAGRKQDLEAWKRLFVAAWERARRAGRVPAGDRRPRHRHRVPPHQRTERPGHGRPHHLHLRLGRPQRARHPGVPARPSHRPDGAGSARPADWGGCMRVLIACEYSGRVRKAFRSRGHDAWSCDILEAEDQSEFHLKTDVLGVLDGLPWPWQKVGGQTRTEYWPSLPWDLMIAHPPCTHLAVSGARHFEPKRLDGRQQKAIDFFLALVRAPIPRIAIENPVCIMSSVWRKPDQTIQPWQFGHGETKATCLWLKGLPHLVPTNVVSGRHPRIHWMSPGPDRWKERSRTYEGVAAAMADQWGRYTDLVTLMEVA